MSPRNRQHRSLHLRQASSETADSLSFNVSQLLRAPFGTTREYNLAVELDELGDGLTMSEPLSGHARLTRTNRGVFAEVSANVQLGLECSRCLTPFAAPIALRFKEEFHPVVDVVTGLPIDVDAEPDSFLIDENHQLDLTEAVRQYLLVNIPMRALCRPDCAGLCPRCGRNLNEGRCDCETEESASGEPGLAALRDWLHQNSN